MRKTGPLQVQSTLYSFQVLEFSAEKKVIYNEYLPNNAKKLKLG